MTKAKKHFFFTILLLTSFLLNAQEALKSIEEEYYDFLSLTGVVERPTLGYRTLSDNVWTFNEIETFEENEDGTFTKVRTPGEESVKHLWKNNNLGTTYTLWEPAAPADNWFTRGLKQGITARIYGPEWFNSYNSAAPYGQNDGGLWQGRGYNTALSAGLRLEGYGFEFTFKPQISWSQNKEFEYIQPNYSGEAFKDKADTYGYYGVPSIDAPQRFGGTSFWNYDWGDTELRYSWKTFTVGFGTQAIWLGPAKLNPILHSNNASSYPKFDIGLRKTRIFIPCLEWDLGYIEARTWVGYLSESEFFDNNDSNNHNMINGFFMAYTPPILSGLTLGISKITLSKWKNDDNYLKYFNPFHSENTGVGTSIGDDQKASFFISILLPKAAIELYGELGIDDYTPNGIKGFTLYPFDTMIFTIGFSKVIDLIKNNNYSAKFLFEWNCFEKNAHRSAGNSNYTFYSHGQIAQGYTNNGQWLGAGNGTGINSQLLSLEIYYPKGTSLIKLQRCNVDNDYAYLKWNVENKYCYKTNLVINILSSYFIKENTIFTVGFTWDCIMNPKYDNILETGILYNHNFQFQFVYSTNF